MRMGTYPGIRKKIECTGLAVRRKASIMMTVGEQASDSDSSETSTMKANPYLYFGKIVALERSTGVHKSAVEIDPCEFLGCESLFRCGVRKNQRSKRGPSIHLARRHPTAANSPSSSTATAIPNALASLTVSQHSVHNGDIPRVA